jgi:hypothetical protein
LRLRIPVGRRRAAGKGKEEHWGEKANHDPGFGG